MDILPQDNMSHKHCPMSNFAPIKGYETLYSINRQGEVISHYHDIILKHGACEGYPKVSLYKHRRSKTHLVHRLLAEAFIPNPLGLPEVNHKDGNRANFDLDNLEWSTSSDNIKHSYRELGRTNGWGTSRQLIDHRKICENCGNSFQYKRKSTRFCSTSCSAKWRIREIPKSSTRARNAKGVYVSYRVIQARYSQEGVK